MMTLQTRVEAFLYREYWQRLPYIGGIALGDVYALKFNAAVCYDNAKYVNSLEGDRRE